MKKIIAVAIAIITLQGCYKNDKKQIDAIEKRLAIIETNQAQQRQSTSKIMEYYNDNDKHANEGVGQDTYVNSLIETLIRHTETTEEFINETDALIAKLNDTIENETRKTIESIRKLKEEKAQKEQGDFLTRIYHAVGIVVALGSLMNFVGRLAGNND